MAHLHHTLLFVLAVAAFLQIAVSQDTCKTAGPQCSSDCKNVVLCPAVGASPIVTVPCFDKDESFCQKTGDNYECTGVTCGNPEAPHPFLCTGVGTYPSAYNCKKSYICTGQGQDPTLECTCSKDDEVYDLASGTCIVADCPRKVADCSSMGQSTELGNGFCYTCNSERNALVFRCPGTFLSALLAPRPKDLACGPYQPPKSL